MVMPKLYNLFISIIFESFMFFKWNEKRIYEFLIILYCNSAIYNQKFSFTNLKNMLMSYLYYIKQLFYQNLF